MSYEQCAASSTWFEHSDCWGEMAGPLVIAFFAFALLGAFLR